MIELYLNGQELRRLNSPLIAENSINFVYAHITFDIDISEYTVTAVFESNGRNYQALVDNDTGTVKVAEEVLKRGSFTIGLILNKGEQKITSTLVNVNVYPAPGEGGGQSEVTPELKDQILSIVAEMRTQVIKSPYIGEDGHWWYYDTKAKDWVKGLEARGENGYDGISPSVVARQTASGVHLTITDSEAVQDVDLKHGADGYSPTVSTAPVARGTQVTITDKSGDHVFTVHDGEDADVDEANAYTDTKCAASLSSSKSYTDGKLNSVLINSAVADGSANYIEFTKDSTGKSFALREFTLYIGNFAKSATGAAQNLTVSIKASGGNYVDIFSINACNASNAAFFRISCRKDVFWVGDSVVSLSYDQSAAAAFGTVARNAAASMNISKAVGVRVSVDSGTMNTFGDSIFLVGKL